MTKNMFVFKKALLFDELRIYHNVGLCLFYPCLMSVVFAYFQSVKCVSPVMKPLLLMVRLY